MRPHPHKDLIIAWANGEIVEYYNPINDTWYEVSSSPDWRPELRFRIKPSIVSRFKELLLQETRLSTYECDGVLLTIKVYHEDLNSILNKLCNQRTETQP